MDVDDYDTYSGDEEFDESTLTNEEYDTLHEVLPKAKEALESYNRNIDELSIKEALYYNYFELEPALEELRSKFPKLKGMSNHFFQTFFLCCRLSFWFYTEDSLSSRLLIP